MPNGCWAAKWGRRRGRRLARGHSLFEARRNAGERCVQRGADTVDNGDDCEGDAARNESIFDGCCAVVIGQKTQNVCHRQFSHADQGVLRWEVFRAA